MSTRKQVSEEDRERAAEVLMRMRREPPASGQANSWAAIATAINATRESEVFRKLAEFKQGGLASVQAVQRFSRRRPRPRGHASAPAEQTVELDERYPIIAEEFAYARAAGVRAEYLEAARARLGAHKGAGPTREQVRETVVEAAKEAKRAADFYRAARVLDD
jgi:hypothetical protein